MQLHSNSWKSVLEQTPPFLQGELRWQISSETEPSVMVSLVAGDAVAEGMPEVAPFWLKNRRRFSLKAGSCRTPVKKADYRLGSFLNGVD